jgi:hypothetical protein
MTDSTPKAIHENASMPITEGANKAIAQHIQELEAYLDNLLVALQHGELPVKQMC